MWRKFPIIYFTLLALPTSIALLPKGEIITIFWLQSWSRLFHRFNDLILNWPVRADLNGSGDAAENYFAAITLIPIAILVAINWRNFARFERWLLTYLRWYLAAILLVYGFGKIFPPGQFEALTTEKLLRPLGDFSPMGFLWAFMGASRPYTMFSGLMEVVAGTLLLFPRFATIGAVVSFGVMANVFALNLCYDVPVKLFSFQLVVLSFWILLQDRRRLIAFATGDQTPPIAPVLINSRELHIDRMVAALIFSGTLYGAVSFSWNHPEEAPRVDRHFRLLDRGFHFINESPDNG